MQIPTVTVLAGGPSPEYISSIESALGVLSHRESLKAHFELVPCLITRDGLWLSESTSELALSAYRSGGSDALQRMEKVISSGTSTPPWVALSSSSAVFATIHGSLGEDGVILGLCRALNIPFVGCDILTSAVCLDKVICKSVLQAADVLQTPYFHVLPHKNPSVELESRLMRFPWIVKPADGGCSIGVSRINSTSELPTALAKARQSYPSSSILVEAAVQNAVEVDVAVMQHPFDDSLIVSSCGLRQNFKNDNTTNAPSTASPSLQENQNQGNVPPWAVPAPGVPLTAVVEMQDLAKCVFRAVRATDFLRVDFFYIALTEEILVNEINTMPNMAEGSMWFKLWAEAGMEPKLWVRTVVEKALRKGEKQPHNPHLAKI